MLSGRGLCDELITHPEESYRMWCVVCDLENLVNEEAMTHVGSQRHNNKKFIKMHGQSNVKKRNVAVRNLIKLV